MSEPLATNLFGFPFYFPSPMLRSFLVNEASTPKADTAFVYHEPVSRVVVDGQSGTVHYFPCDHFVFLKSSAVVRPFFFSIELP